MYEHQCVYAYEKRKENLLMRKIIFFLTLFLLNEAAMSATQPMINTSRLLLAKLRGGDYAHAGDEEAIDTVLQKLIAIDPAIHTRSTLDVGSGFGGTANYLYQKGFRDIQGIDLDAAAVAYADGKYNPITFTVASALVSDKIYPASAFGLVYLFNVIYAIQDKATLLKKLATITKPGGILVLFDYSSEQTLPINDLANKPMHPIQLAKIKQKLKATGWEIIEIVDITSHCILWYKQLLQKLSAQSVMLEKEFSVQDINKVTRTFTFLLEQLEKGQMGSVIIYATKLA